MPNETMLKILFELAEQSQPVTFRSCEITDASVIVANLLRAGAPKVILLLEIPDGQRDQRDIEYTETAEVHFTSAMIAALDLEDGDTLDVKARKISFQNSVQLTVTLTKAT